MNKPESYINFAGQDWHALKLYLKDREQHYVRALIVADTHDKSNQVRGTLLFIKQLLALETAAEQAASQGTPHE